MTSLKHFLCAASLSREVQLVEVHTRGPLTSLYYILLCVYVVIEIVSSGGSRGGARGHRPPFFVGKTKNIAEERKVGTATKKIATPPPPLILQGLDPPLVPLHVSATCPLMCWHYEITSAV